MPNAAHLHLLVNHIPIIGSVFALLVLAWGLLRKSDDVVRTGLLALFVIGLISYGVQLTGEPAEEAVEHLAGVSRRVIHAHEEAAEVATWAMLATGLLALASLVTWRGRRKLARALTFATLVVGLAGAGLMARAGNLGGKIRHPEIDDAAATQPAAEPGDDHGGER
ncbi:MAG TPA: hypothetical protein VFQ39_14480 [Longimicrobium sp.]|nr:hypothetical protein [Longimicrobium sp.]